MSSFQTSNRGRSTRTERSGLSIPRQGLRFDPEKVLLDPYGRAVAVPENYRRLAAMHPGDNTATAMKSVVADTGTYDWEGDQPLHRPFAEDGDL